MRLPRLLVGLSLVLPLAACAAPSDGESVGDAEGAAGKAKKTTVLQAKAGTPAEGLKTELLVTNEASTAERSILLVLRRGTAAPRTLTCTMTATVRDTGERSGGLTCDFVGQTGFRPGIDECHMSLYRKIQAAGDEVSARMTCANPAAITAEQHDLLKHVFGGAANYPTVPNRSSSSSTGEVAGGELDFGVASTSSSIETDPFALMGHLAAAAALAVGKQATVSYGQPIPAEKRGATRMLTVYPELGDMTTAVNFSAQLGVAVGRGASLLGEDGKIASAADLAARLAGLVSAQ